MITIRNYRKGDYQAIATNLKAHKMYDDIWDSLENFTAIAGEQGENIIVATDNNLVIGSLNLMAYGKHIVFIYRFAVSEAYQGQGVGTQLLEYADKILKQRGYKEIAIFEDVDNLKLRTFYEKRGYITHGNAWLAMWKPL